MSRIRWRAGAALAVLAAAGAALHAGAQAPVSAGASSPSGGRNVYLAGSMVRPAGPVAGDFVAFGGRVVVDQPVAGDALLGGGSVDVRAPIGDDLRAGGGDVHVDTTVGGELYAAGGNVTLGKSAQVGQGAALAGGLVTIDGKVSGPLRVTAQRVVLNGEVSGDARLIAETVELGPVARIGGALNHSSKELKRAEGATVGGAVTHEEPAPAPSERAVERHWEGQWRGSGPAWAGMVMGYLGLLAAAAVFVLLFPRFTAEAPELIRTLPWLALAVGFGVLVGVPVLGVLLLITLLGIPLGIATFALYPLLLLMGYLSGVLFVAQRIRLALHKQDAGVFRTSIGYVALALLALMLLGRLPVVGSLTVFITTVAGIGACVLEWHRRRQLEPTAPTRPAAGA